MPFDRDSGLVFSERVVKKSKKRPNGYDDFTRSLGRPPKLRSTGLGSDALYLMALRRLLCNLKNIDAATLSTVPGGILEKIWIAIQRS